MSCHQGLQVERRCKVYLEPGPVLFVIPPGLPLELPSCQVLLVGARHVVEGEEERFCIQLLKEGRVVQHGQLHLRVGSWNATRW